MANDDSFFREVNEDLRSDRAKALWARFGPIIIAIAVVIVIGTAGYNGYRYWSDLQASRSGDQFLAALNLARDGQTEAALTELEVIESDGHGAYPVLARLRAATILADSGALEEAVSSFNAIAADSTVPEVLRQTVAIRAGYLMVDYASYADVSSAVERFAVSGHAMRHGAREILALSAWKSGDMERARQWIDEIDADPSTPAGIARRVAILSDLLTARDTDAAR